MKHLVFLYSLFSITILVSCISDGITNCAIPCQLGIQQNETITVAQFLDLLTTEGWIQDNPDRALYAIYQADAFSNVLETTTSIALDGPNADPNITVITLYIGNVGGIDPHNEAIPDEEIESIAIESKLTLAESLQIFGFPDGGKILPFYVEGDLDETNPCPDRSHYIAYYNDGMTIIRAEVKRPIWLNIWTSPVEIIYPFGNGLTFWIGRYDRMDHKPCLPG